MKSHHLLVVGVAFAFCAMPQDLAAGKPECTDIPQIAEEGSAAYDEQIEQITREYRQKLSDLEQTYKARLEQVRTKYVAETAATKLPSTAKPRVAVFMQFKPNASDGKSHVLHILTSDGKSILFPFQFLKQEHGKWRRTKDRIEYTWKGRERSGSAFIKYNPSRRGYSFPNAERDDLINAGGHLVVGDPVFLQNGESSKGESDGEQ